MLFALLLTTDVAFLAMFAMLAIHVTDDAGWLLTYDRSYAEVFQYIKLFWLVVLPVVLWWRWRQLAYLSLAAVFAVVLADDYAMLHEHWGTALISVLGLEDGWLVEAQDFGELAVFAAYTAVVGLLLAAGYRWAETDVRRLLLETLGLLALLAVFAVGVDLLHALPTPPLVNDLIGASEDGGEMLVVSALVWRTVGHLLERSVLAAADREVT